ncbi:MAG: RNA polymerase factor sigma-54 [Bacteroidales bacterium]|jgi:RNA polymerase sigma-54 factor|nr:RNA polymerase factor sigma-54 [Bacteroidales bacterium]
MLEQNLQQQMRQKLSPQQIILMKLMQIPVMLLEQRIKEEIENNPALDISEDSSDNQEDKSEDFEMPEEEKDDKNEETERESEPEDEFSLEDYLDEDDIPDYRLYSNNYSENDDTKEFPIVSSKSFHESLLDQLRLRDLNEIDMLIALQIIGSIDDSGYLSRNPEIIADDLAVMKNIQVDGKHVIEILQVIQDFDPAGIGARNLRECLQLQLKRKKPTQAVRHAIIVLDKHFSEFSKKHYDRIMRRTGMTEKQLRNAVAEILKLNPKPGDFSPDIYLTNQSIIPDFLLYMSGDKLDIQLNNSHIPELHISRDYQEMLEHYSKSNSKSNSQDKEAIQFVRNRIDAARWFIDAIRQRKNTLMAVMNAIATVQKEYFISGDEGDLKPMILNDIAQKLEMDVSTISRVVSSKYVQTPFGTFLLKNLFSESFQNEDGDEISTKEIKQVVKKLIEKEDKSSPLTDDKLLDLLKKQGYGIARRTVAKYREQLGIAPSRMRKEL